jgi:hypothetical protein
MNYDTTHISHNCYNILPIILIQLCIVLLFEFLIYYFVINAKLYNHISFYISQNIPSQIKNYNQYLKTYTDNEQKHVNKMNTTGIVIFSALMCGITILFISYVYIVTYIMKIKLEWTSIISVSIGTFALIAIMELVYIFEIDDTTFDACKIEIDFLNKLKNITN